MVRKSLKGKIVGHISRDATAIEAREKPVKKPKEETHPEITLSLSKTTSKF